MIKDIHSAGAISFFFILFEKFTTINQNLHHWGGQWISTNHSLLKNRKGYFIKNGLLL